MSLTAGALPKQADTTATASGRASLSTKQRLVAWSAALLLFAAACLKAWPLITGQALETQATSLGKLILIQGEILLALWLVSEVASAWAFRTAIVFFAGAACVNLRSIWLGEVSCGCFGKVEVPPWVSFWINGVAITALVLIRPRFLGGMVANAVASVKSVGWVAPVCVLILVGGATGTFMWNSFRPVVIEVSREIDLGVLEAGTKKEVAISLRNISDKPVTIVGAKTSCTCSLVKGLPIVISAGESADVVLSVVPPARSQFEGKIVCYSNSKHAASIRCRYFARVHVANNKTNEAIR